MKQASQCAQHTMEGVCGHSKECVWWGSTAKVERRNNSQFSQVWMWFNKSYGLLSCGSISDEDPLWVGLSVFAATFHKAEYGRGQMVPPFLNRQANVRAFTHFCTPIRSSGPQFLLLSPPSLSPCISRWPHRKINCQQSIFLLIRTSLSYYHRMKWLWH